MSARFGLAAMGASTAAGTTFLVNENCEGTGTPAGWSTVTGSPNWDYTTSPAPLADVQSLFLNTNGVSTTVQIDFTTQTEFWIYFMMNLIGSLPGSAQGFGAIRPNGGGTPVLAVNLAATGRLGLAGNTTASPATAISLSTTYHVWLHVMAGSGANSVLDLGYSTNGVRPTSGGTYNQIANGNLTVGLGRLILGATPTTQTVDCIFDNIRVAATQIGDNGT